MFKEKRGDIVINQFQIQNSYIGETYIIGNKINISGKEIELPKNIDTTKITIINNKIFVDGFEFKNGKWVKTLRALWHKYF